MHSERVTLALTIPKAHYHNLTTTEYITRVTYGSETRHHSHSYQFKREFDFLLNFKQHVHVLSFQSVICRSNTAMQHG